MHILRAEKLKLNRSGMVTMTIVVPLLCSLFAFLFGGPFQVIAQTIYWWMSVFFYFLMQLMLYQNGRLEHVAGEGFNIQVQPAKRPLIQVVKIAWTCYYGLIATGCLIVILWGFIHIMPPVAQFKHVTDIIGGMGLIYLNSLWILPFFYFLSRRLNGLIIMLVHLIVSVLIVPFIAGSRFYYLVPFCYPFKVAKYVFHILEGGDMVVGAVSNDSSAVILTTCLAVGLFICGLIAVYRSERHG